MKPSKAELSRLRRAKETLQQQFGKRAWFRGVGIAPSDKGLVLRLNVDDREPITPDEIPIECEGCKLDIVHIANYQKRKHETQ